MRLTFVQKELITPISGVCGMNMLILQGSKGKRPMNVLRGMYYIVVQMTRIKILKVLMYYTTLLIKHRIRPFSIIKIYSVESQDLRMPCHVNIRQ